jgi:hypothetical protein
MGDGIGGMQSAGRQSGRQAGGRAGRQAARQVENDRDIQQGMDGHPARDCRCGMRENRHARGCGVADKGGICRRMQVNSE